MTTAWSWYVIGLVLFTVGLAGLGFALDQMMTHTDPNAAMKALAGLGSRWELWHFRTGFNLLRYAGDDPLLRSGVDAHAPFLPVRPPVSRPRGRGTRAGRTCSGSRPWAPPGR